ncbi:hypothetical protein OPIT5_03880 [Opitutaceae bacterium TAV5]|nr:hypothetical protein OPIT5_03880 [Opitutaceae bacterium TAV5]
MPDSNDLLSRKSLAAALGRGYAYVTAMIRDGFPMPANRATLAEAREWLRANPDFRQYRPMKQNKENRSKTKQNLSPADRPTYDSLPPHGKAIADVIGIPDLLRLAAAAKSRHVSIPHALKEDCAVVQMVGMEVARKLHAAFPGEVILVPQCWTAALKPKAIAAMQKATILGVGIRDLACITGLSESGVRAALRRSVTGSGVVDGVIRDAKSMQENDGWRGEAGGGIGSSLGGGVRVENNRRVSVVSEKL